MAAPWLVFAIVGLLISAAYFLTPGAAAAGVYDAVTLAPVGAIAIGIRRNRPARVRPWILLAWGLALASAGDAYLTYHQLVFGTQPFPSAADALFLAGDLVLIAAMLALIRSHSRGADWAALIDALIIAIGIGILAWAFWIVRYARDPTLSLLPKAISLAYPLLDVVLLATLARLALGPGGKAVAMRLLGVSVLVLLGADVAFGLTTLDGSYYPGCAVDGGFLLAAVLFGTAALHPSMRMLSTPAPERELTLTRTRLVTLAVSALIGPVVLGIKSLNGSLVDGRILRVAALVVFLLVLARMWGLVRKLAETAANSALATAREQTLRQAAAALVGAHDDQSVLAVACEAIAAVVHEGEGTDITAWSVAAGLITATAGVLHRDPAAPAARLLFKALPERVRAQLLTGRMVQLRPPGGPLRAALGFEADNRVGLAVPVLVGGTLTAVFTIRSQRPLREEVKGSVLTLRDQSAVALETAQLSADLHRRSAERRFAALIEHSSDVITILDERAVITYQTPSAGQELGYGRGALTATKLIDLVHPDDRARAGEFLSQLSDQRGACAPVEWRMRTREGGWRLFENAGNNLRHDPDVAGVVIDSRDVTERKRLEAQLEHQALHDDLTGLANRALFRDRTEHALARLQDQSQHHAVLLLDLDNFKAINDSIGDSAGDQLLLEVARRLRSCCRRGDTASRLGADEFAVLLEDVEDAGEAVGVAERISAALHDPPLIIGGRETFVTASIGLAVKADAGEVDEIIRNADIAMYLAKRLGKARIELFTPGMQADALEALELESDLRRALERQQFYLQYQPIVELERGHITGVEALIRWRHPSRGIVAPLEFIPAAERTGLIVPIGRWVLQEACRQARDWEQAYPNAPLIMNVNLSARQLHDPRLIEDVAAALQSSGCEPRRLTLEITESVMMQDTDTTIARLNELTALGVGLAVDDFGTGYSSLSYLRRFPVGVLKVDKSFVDDVVASSGVSALTEGIVSLARALHLDVIAEGIETVEQAEHLRMMNCRLGQGYHFAKPIDSQDLGRLLGDQRAADQRPAGEPALAVD
ncbi:MAG: EAL domain-containing protein [Solirubrobacteraceae bacterium]